MNNSSEKPAQRLERLLGEVQETKKQIENCKHIFSDPYPDTRIVYDAVYKGLEPHGSDPIPIYDHIPREEHGWSRICSGCGYTQYTAKTKPVIERHVPDFDNGGAK